MPSHTRAVRAAALLALLAAPPAHAQGMQLTVAGFAFVDAAVTSQGTRAVLPADTRIFAPGAKVTGATGCPTTPYRTDGLMVVVMDYSGAPTAGSVTVTEHRADGAARARAPYYLDFNPGRLLQVLGPIFADGTYDVTVEYGFAGAQKPAPVRASITLARSCGQ